MVVKRTLSLAELGYDLMDRKRNILIREMMSLIDAAADLQKRIDSTFGAAYQALQMASITLGSCDTLAQNVDIEDSLQVRTRSVMGVELPAVTIEDKVLSIPYGFMFTNLDLDEAVLRFTEVKRLIREMAEVETSVYRLSTAIKKTQKRANALENIIIPDLKGKVKFITDALEEKEREEFVRLKVLKR